jgi:hypothetical protein
MHPSRIHAWKTELLKGAEGFFNQSQKVSTVENNQAQLIAVLEKKIGQLVVENDFLKKSFGNAQQRRGLT